MLLDTIMDGEFSVSDKGPPRTKDIRKRLQVLWKLGTG